MQVILSPSILQSTFHLLLLYFTLNPPMKGKSIWLLLKMLTQEMFSRFLDFSGRGGCRRPGGAARWKKNLAKFPWY